MLTQVDLSKYEALPRHTPLPSNPNVAIRAQNESKFLYPFNFSLWIGMMVLMTRQRLDVHWLLAMDMMTFS